MLRTVGLFVVTALAEILGCYLPYRWLRRGTRVRLTAIPSRARIRERSSEVFRRSGRSRVSLAVRRLIAALLIVLPVHASAVSAFAASQREAALRAVIARGKSLELPTKYLPPPGEKIEHYASGYAKIMCTAVFVTGLDPAFAAENVGYFTAPYEERAKLGTPKIDRQKQTVEVTMPNGTVRVAKHVASQGCVTLPIGKTDVFFKPSIVTPNVPDPKTTPWPMGDGLPAGPTPEGVDMAIVQAAAEAAFDPAAMTGAFVVTYKGRIIAERYGENITPTTALESWSMGKSLSGTLMGILIKQGVYTLDQ